MISSRWCGALLVVAALTGCASTASAEALPTSGRIDYQLGGAYDPPSDVTVVARDSTDEPLEGVYSICYLNGFQSQPQQADLWLDEHPTLLLRDTDGLPLVDPGWPDEMALDTSTGEKREQLSSIIGEWIDGCRDSGFQAVEFDNLDSFTRFDGITEDDNLALATLLVARAHADGLAAGQKNTGEIGARGKDEVGFDFVVAEECHQYDECSGYADVYGDQFIDIEYEPAADDLCSDPDIPLLTIVRDRELTPGGTFWSCDE